MSGGAVDRLTFDKIDFDARVATVFGVRQGDVPDRLLERRFGERAGEESRSG